MNKKKINEGYNVILKTKKTKIFFEKIARAFFWEPKNGNEPEFSSKKFWAFAFSFLALWEKFKLVFIPAYHFSVVLTEAKVSENVIITAMVSMDSMAFAALAVYGIAKIKKAP